MRENPPFPKPQGRFIRRLICGIEAVQDVKLGAIARALGEPIALKRTSERLTGSGRRPMFSIR